MEGLASIALAVAQLEKQNDSRGSQGYTSDEIMKHFALPPRQTFEGNTPRVVSTDSSYNENEKTTGEIQNDGGDDKSPVTISSLPQDTKTPVSSVEDSSQVAEACPRQPVTVPVVSNPSTPSSSPQAIVSSSSSLSSASTDAGNGETAVTIEDPQIPSSAADLVIRQHVPPPPPPTQVITDVLVDDVLCGRGGETNHHPGNIRYRTLVKCYQPLYIASKRRDKPKIAQKIVWTIRERGGRFLKKDVRSNTWRDVGNTKAREKTSQALREGAPELRSVNGKEMVQEQQEVQQSSNILKANALKGNTTIRRHPAMVTPPSSFVNATDARDSDKNNKRKRSSLSDFAAVVVAATEPIGSLSPCTPPPISPNSFVATVSADDDDLNEASKTKPSYNKVAIRGPRLKRLKRRLECFEADTACAVGSR